MSNLAHSAVLALRRFAYAGHSVRQRRPRLGLALAGGFARGIAHVGVLRAFEEFGVRIDCIAGTSVGALIGSAYAAGATLEEMEVMAGSTQFKDFARWTFSWMGLATNERLETYLRHFTEKTRFEEMRIPLAISATDVLTGESVYLTKGLLGPALRASCAYPGLFLPVEYEGRTLVDGFLTAPVPVEGARMLGAERVIAVYLDPGIVSKPKNMVDVINRSFSILQKQSQAEWRNQADIVIEPDVRGIRWDEFARSPDMIAAGEQAARAAMPAIRAMLAEPVMLQEAADTA